MKTAVEWLIDKLMPSIALQTKYIDELKEQAKEMEKQQISYAWDDGYAMGENGLDLESNKYYNETFNK